MSFASQLIALLLACVGPAQPPRPVLARPPDLGVSCAEANSIACDRVRLAVWVRGPAETVQATVAGRRLELHRDAEASFWTGALHPAGLLDGDLRVTPDRGRFWWAGAHPKTARLRVVVHRPDGSTGQATTSVALRAGWG